MNTNILIAYDTMHGSTGETAQYMGKTLLAQGLDADVRLITQELNISGYDLMIICCPIIYERFTDHTIDLIRRSKDPLMNTPTALFVACLDNLLAKAGEEGRVGHNVIDPLLDEFPFFHPISIGIFAGVLDYDKYSVNIARGMKSVLQPFGAPLEGKHDYRNWENITSWVLEIVKKQQSS